jgi:hypothetical protein
MLPPMGALIVGPCPECQGLVAVFCGRALGLDRDIMLSGSVEKKRDHLMTVLNTFLEERVNQLLKEAIHDESPKEQEAESVDEEDLPEPLDVRGALTAPSRVISNVITQTELDDFVHVHLNLIDNTDYFKAIFG